jgi:hypothetical protein
MRQSVKELELEYRPYDFKNGVFLIIPHYPLVIPYAYIHIIQTYMYITGQE